MHDYDLRDLKLAGVQWELTDLPMAVLSAQKAMAAPAPASDASRGTPNAAGRVATAIVPPIAPIQTISLDTAVAMAARPVDISSLMRMISEFNHPLRGAATNVVLPSVATNPNGVVIVTDMPGADDDAAATIMSGAAGELLDKMIGAIGMSRESVSIVPMLFWRTPGGRAPTREELDLARPFVDRVLQMLNPRIIITFGTLAASEIAGVTLPRGHGVVVDKDNIKIIPIFHPNYLLLKPAAKRDAWVALQSVQNLLKNQ
ncbi:MAG: uracil-DNA glycosylase [Muribaculaceae bacterium]|nr:uracil-DNA glycosylase [Muribaculaceae bacterium]